MSVIGLAEPLKIDLVLDAIREQSIDDSGVVVMSQQDADRLVQLIDGLREAVIQIYWIMHSSLVGRNFELHNEVQEHLLKALSEHEYGS